MKYAGAPAFRQALGNHINRVNGEHGLSHTRIRKLIVFDRLLARLLAASPEGGCSRGSWRGVIASRMGGNDALLRRLSHE